MRTVEECYTYVIARRNELAAQRRKGRAIALKATASICGIAVIVGIAVISKNEENRGGKYIYSSQNCVTSGEHDDNNNLIANSMVGTTEYDNALNIGEIEIADSVLNYYINIPSLFEMSRDEILDHFGLNKDFELSSVVPELHETMPKNGVLNIGGKHGLHRMCFINENDECVWRELSPLWDSDEFEFENTDGSQSATVIFQRKYDETDVIIGLRSNIWSVLEDGSFSTEPFYALPPSIVAGVEMRIAKRNIGGYYAEFSTDNLCVGLSTKGISEEKTIEILEYLAEYVGAANVSKSKDISIDTYNVSYSAVVF